MAVAHPFLLLRGRWTPVLPAVFFIGSLFILAHLKKEARKMKRCPICQTQYSDEADYCLKCKTLLLAQEETPENQRPKQKINVKGLLTAIIATFAFIGLMMFLYHLLANAR